MTNPGECSSLSLNHWESAVRPMYFSLKIRSTPPANRGFKRKIKLTGAPAWEPPGNPGKLKLQPGIGALRSQKCVRCVFMFWGVPLEFCYEPDILNRGCGVLQS